MAERAHFGTGGFAITRVFAAERERVWREWTEPEAFADWFGGTQCEIPLSTVSMDVRPGGVWQATMYCAPGRREIHWSGEYLEVSAPERLVFSVTDQSGEGAHEIVTVVLEEAGDGHTLMHFEQRGHKRPDEYEYTEHGWGAFFARLDERLAAD